MKILSTALMGKTIEEHTTFGFRVRSFFSWWFRGYRLLSYNELVELVQAGVIKHVSPDMINQSSIDLTLGSDIVRETSPSKHRATLSLRRRDPFHSVRENIRFGYVMRPGEFLLAHTEQEFNLPENISAEFSLKSSVGRMGLNHMLAGWCDAGWNSSVLTLELMNCLRHHQIEIKWGDPIGQMKFFRHRRVPKSKSYATRGRYNNDKTVEEIKP